MTSSLIDFVNSAGGRWAGWALTTLLDAAVLLAIVGLAWLAIRRRVAPQAGYCLFLLVPLKLLIPAGMTVPVAVTQWTPSGLASSWFNRAELPEPSENRFPVKLQGVARVTARATSPIPGHELPAQPQQVAARFVPIASSPDGESQRLVTPAARPAAQPVPVRPRVSIPAMAMIAWIGGILVLSGRLARTQLQFRAQLKHSSRLDASKLSVNLHELCRKAGVAQAIDIVESDIIAAPAVWGIARPTIILPRGLATSLTAQQLRWVLLHELAHVRRADLVVVALQRFAAILQFFNPAIWIANRIIHRLREYACDDLAVSLGEVDGVESGEAFLHVLRHAGNRRRGLHGALGVFGLDSRASCLLRVHRLLDTERPIRTALGPWSLGAIVLLALVSLPHFRASGEVAPADSQSPVKQSQTPGQPSQKAPTNEATAENGKEFDLRIVGPDGRPVPAALVELRANPILTAKQIRQGKYVKESSYGTLVQTDDQGRLLITFPKAPASFSVDMTIPRYGPYWAAWSSESHAEPVPASFTAELEAAWSVGGIIVDDAGKPVEGVTVAPSIEFKKRPGDAQQLAIGTRLKTDAAGKWRFDSVPVAMAELYVGINHPNFKPVSRSLSRRASGIERGQEPSAKIVLDRGLAVTGKVSDEAGKPVAGALVRTKLINDIREARTDGNGVYRLLGCEPRLARIVVSAAGKATDMKELNIDPQISPVNFQMKPARTVRVRVLDMQGNPVPKARIFFQQWRGRFSYFEFDHVSQYTDENGVWVWHEAPLDEFKADICPPDGMQLLEQPLIAREEEYVFRTPSALVISGKVIDAVTKKPIKAFRVVPGGRYNQNEMIWNRNESFTATDGHFEIRHYRGDLAHLIRIEANGYEAAVSRDIKSTEGTISIDFELKTGKNVVAKVVTPRNLPAVRAKVALGIAGSQISIKNGEIDDASTSCARDETDLSGLMHFPAQDKNFQLVITHPTGFAHIVSTPEWELTRIIHLEPWSRVEGTFRVGKKPTANVPITLDVSRLQSFGFGKDVPRIFTQHQANSGPDGRFVFERVVPGTGQIGRSITLMADQGATEVTSSRTVAADFPAGKTVQIDIGGTGRPVVGTIRPPDGFDENQKVRWNFALVRVTSPESENPAKSPYFMATVDRDGTFRIDDVPAGKYSLSVQFLPNEVGHLVNHRFEVTSLESDPAAQPVDLGVLKLEKP